MYGSNGNQPDDGMWLGDAVTSNTDQSRVDKAHQPKTQEKRGQGRKGQGRRGQGRSQERRDQGTIIGETRGGGARRPPLGRPGRRGQETTVGVQPGSADPSTGGEL